MRLVKLEKNGVAFEVVDTWIDAGVQHGLGDGTFDVTAGAASWNALTKENPSQLLLLEQIHSDLFLEVSSANLESYSARPQADAWLCTERGSLGHSVSLGIKTADCVPILILNRERNICAALHCGWRGTVSGLLLRTLERIGEAGADISGLEVAVGPSAGACCYEVGAEVAEVFLQAATTSARSENALDVVLKRDAKLFGNLPKLIELQLASFNIPKKQIVFSNDCTICTNRFYSFRRNPSSPARQLSFINC